MGKTIEKKIRDFGGMVTREKAWIAAIGLMIIGFAIRLLFLERLPHGLNQDEASSGYEAWALLQSGMDRHGKSWPVLLISWGSGQNVLLSYLAIPWVALFGLRPLSVRLPNAIAGCVTLFFMWKIARRTRGERFGLCALFFLTINPWHIMANRWGLEGNLLPAFLWGACYYLSCAEEKPHTLVGAAICLGLAPYAYGTVFFLLPPFLLWSLWKLRRSLRNRWTIIALAIFIVIIFPITLCQVNNIIGNKDIHLGCFTLPLLTENRQNATSVLGGNVLTQISHNIYEFFSILHGGVGGEDSMNALPFSKGGILYFFGFPLAVLGLLVSIRENHRQAEWPVFALLCCAGLCAALINVNINRINMIWLPLIYYSALGAAWFTKHFRIQKVISIAVVLICFLYFGKSYLSVFGPPGYYGYYPELGKAIDAAINMDHKTIYVTTEIKQPYIFALFYSKTPPENYVKSVEYIDENSAFQIVKRFEGFEFSDRNNSDLLVLSRTEAEEHEKEILEVYGMFVVCR